MRKSDGKTCFTIFWSLLLSIVILGCAPLLMAQTTEGNLVGVIADPSAAVIPNASVALVNTQTGLKYSVQSGSDGLYRFNSIPVGTYNLTVTANGFTQGGLKNVAVQLNNTTTANVTLQVTGVATTVEVVEAPASIDTTTSQLQSTYTSQQVEDQPIIESSGNFFGALNLSLLSAGVASSGGVGQGTGPSVGGQRPTNNNFMIEGVDNNNKTVTGPLVYVPVEATDEFTVLQNQYSAEFGHSTGGQFNTVVKSGTNAVHGQVYEYMQNRNLNAIDQDYKRQGILSSPRYDQNRVGGAIGGPIIKNKWFYFGDFEYAPLGEAYTLSPPVFAPTAAGYATLASLPGLSQTNLGILKTYLPAAPINNEGTTIVGSAAIPLGITPVVGAYYTNQYAGVVSTDYKISDPDQLHGRFIFNRVDALDNTANLPAFWTTLPQRFYIFTLTENHTFSPTVTNEFRLGFNRFNQFYTVPNFSFPGLDQFPNITIDDDLGVQIGPDPNAPQYSIQNTYQMVENLSWIKGKHYFKVGADIRDFIAPSQFIQRERGDYDYENLNQYLTDQVPTDLAERNLGSTSYYGNSWATYFYAQDDFHVRSNVTLNLGIRYERSTVPVGMRFQALNAIADVPGLITFGVPQPQNKNFAPRIGFAYSPGKSGTTSIRAGFGMAYDVIYDNIGTNAYPPELSSTVDADNYPTQFTAPFLAHGGIAPGSVAVGSNLTPAQARAATSSYIPNQVLPYSVQWTLGVQHEFHHDYTLEVRYLGTHGVHLLVQDQINKVATVTPANSLPTYLNAPPQAVLDASPRSLADLEAIPNNPIYGPAGFTGNITAWEPLGSSYYDGLAVQLNRRFAKGLSSTVSYTWSHNIDDATATLFSTYLTPRRPEDFQNIAIDKSASALDRRQRLTLNWMWEVPWMKNSPNWFAKNLMGNWRWVTTYTYESPEYVTAQSGDDANLDGDTAGDRTITNVSGNPKLGSDVTPLLRTSAGGVTCATANPAPDACVVGYVANNPAAMYIRAAAGTYPTTGRNTLPTNPIDNFDMSFAKRFAITEGKSLEFRGDFSNMFNHPEYVPGYVNSVRLNQTYITARDFLIPGNSTFQQWDQIFPSNARSTQLSLRVIF